MSQTRELHWDDKRIFDAVVLRVREQKNWAAAIKVATLIRDEYEAKLDDFQAAYTYYIEQAERDANRSVAQRTPPAAQGGKYVPVEDGEYQSISVLTLSNGTVGLVTSCGDSLGTFPVHHWLSPDIRLCRWQEGDEGDGE